MKLRRALSILMVVALLLTSFTLASAQTIVRKDTTTPNYNGGALIRLEGRIKISMTGKTSFIAMLWMDKPANFNNITVGSVTKSYPDETRILLDIPARKGVNAKTKYHNKDVIVEGILLATQAAGGYVPAMPFQLTKPDGATAVRIAATKPKAKKISIESVDGFYTIEQTATKQMKPIILPEGALQLASSWSSSNTKVAKVSSDGLVTGVWPGSCYITGKIANGKTAKKKITVTASTAAGIIISEREVTLKKGDTKTLKAMYNNSTSNMFWESSNPTIVSVGMDTGKIRARSAGVAVITVKSRLNNSQSATCTVSVPGSGGIVPVGPEATGVEIKLEGNALLAPNAAKQCTLVFTPSNARKPGIQWFSSDNEIATVDGAGKITAKKPGVVVIEARTDLTKDSKPIGATKLVLVTATQSVAALSDADKKFTYTYTTKDADDKDKTVTNDITLPANYDTFKAKVPGGHDSVHATAGPNYYNNAQAIGINYALWYTADSTKAFRYFNTDVGDKSFKTNRGVSGASDASDVATLYGNPGVITLAAPKYTLSGSTVTVDYGTPSVNYYFADGMIFQFRLDLATQKVTQMAFFLKA